jgi:hypothetical protein
MNTDMQTATVNTYPLETLVSRRDELNAIINESKALLEAINNDLLERVLLSSDKKLALEDSRYVCIETKHLYSKVPLEFCKSVNAVKETPDSKKLGAMLDAYTKYNIGVPIPGLVMSDYIKIK